MTTFKLGDRVKPGDIDERSLNAYRGMRGTVSDIGRHDFVRVEWDCNHGFVAKGDWHKAKELSHATEPIIVGSLENGVRVLVDACTTGWIWCAVNAANTQVHEGPFAFRDAGSASADARQWLENVSQVYVADRRDPNHCGLCLQWQTACRCSKGTK